MKNVRLSLVLLVMCLFVVCASGCPVTTPLASTPAATTTTGIHTTTRKPAIYLYPVEKTDVSVSLDYHGTLTCTYPEYTGLWQVTAYPDGTLVNRADGREYSYLYWEGVTDTPYDFSKGFVVRGADTAAFLLEKFTLLGLTPREYNEFIVYWLPQMQENPFNLISFQGEAYTRNAVLDITPRPDSLLRVFMAYRPLQNFMDIKEQPLAAFQREGFVVVEWGGSCVP